MNSLSFFTNVGIFLKHSLLLLTLVNGFLPVWNAERWTRVPKKKKDEQYHGCCGQISPNKLVGGWVFLMGAFLCIVLISMGTHYPVCLQPGPSLTTFLFFSKISLLIMTTKNLLTVFQDLQATLLYKSNAENTIFFLGKI